MPTTTKIKAQRNARQVRGARSPITKIKTDQAGCTTVIGTPERPLSLTPQCTRIITSRVSSTRFRVVARRSLIQRVVVLGAPVTVGVAGVADIVPFRLDAGDTFRIPRNRQVLYTIPIDSDGLIEDEGGVLVEMDSPEIG